MTKALIIDSSYLIYRSYFAYPELTYNLKKQDLQEVLELLPLEMQSLPQDLLENFPLGSIFGFIKTIFYLVKDIEPDFLVFTFDLKEKTWRHALKTDYKEGRTPPEAKMLAQIPLIKQWTSKITENNFSKAGFEADDWIYTASQNFLKANPENSQVLVFSADRDLYQMLVWDQVKFLKTSKFGQLTFFGRDEFIEKYNLDPEQWVDLKSIVGDPSDNLIGIKGIGEKTASRILEIFGSLKNLFLSQGLDISELTSQQKFDLKMLEKFKLENSRYQNFLQEIVNQKDLVLENYKLAKLSYVENREVKKGFDLSNALGDLEKYNFRSLINFYNQHLAKPSQVQDSLF